MRLVLASMKGLAFIVVIFASQAQADLVAAFAAERTTAESVQQMRSLPHDLVGYSPGVRGTAFDFMSDTASVQVVDHPQLAFTGSFTISLWVYPRSLPGKHSSNAQIFFRGDDRNGNDPYCLCLRSDGVWHFAINNAEASAVVQAPAMLNQWTHLVASFDAPRGRMRLYANDELIAQTFTTAAPFRDLEVQWDPGVSIGNVQRPQQNRHWQPFDGLIDEILVFNDARAVASRDAFVGGSRTEARKEKVVSLFDAPTSLIP